MTLLQKLDKFPPFVCRIVALKNNGRAAMSTRDIARASGLSPASISYISQMTSWAHITLETMDRFTQACGVNHLNLTKQLAYLRRSPMSHLRRADKTQRAMFLRLFAKAK